MNLTEKLIQCGKEVYRKFPYINHGGCCVYATMIVCELQKHNIEAVGIATGGYYTDHNLTIDKVRHLVRKNTANEWNRNGITFHHVGVEFILNGKKFHYDTSGVWKPTGKLDKHQIYQGRFSFKELQGLSKQINCCWNTTFDRHDIPAIRRIVKKHLTVDKI